MELNWYALAVQPRKEAFVERQLRSLGHTAVCPRYYKRVRHARKISRVAAPFFPGYLFVKLDLSEKSWRRVHTIPGSIGLIKFNNRPSPLARSFIDQFIRHLSDGGIVCVTPKLKIGDRIRAVGGPFDEQTGEVIGLSENDRVKILLEALNRKVTATLPKTAVIVAA